MLSCAGDPLPVATWGDIAVPSHLDLYYSRLNPAVTTPDPRSLRGGLDFFDCDLQRSGIRVGTFLQLTCKPIPWSWPVIPALKQIFGQVFPKLHTFGLSPLLIPDPNLPTTPARGILIRIRDQPGAVPSISTSLLIQVPWSRWSQDTTKARSKSWKTTHNFSTFATMVNCPLCPGISSGYASAHKCILNTTRSCPNYLKVLK